MHSFGGTENRRDSRTLETEKVRQKPNLPLQTHLCFPRNGTDLRDRLPPNRDYHFVCTLGHFDNLRPI